MVSSGNLKNVTLALGGSRLMLRGALGRVAAGG
jgi:hypothetical protein